MGLIAVIFIYFTSLQWTIKNQGLDAVMNYGRKSLSSQLQNPNITEKEAVDLKFAICNLLSRGPYRSSKFFNPLSPNSAQNQFSPNDIHKLSWAKSMRINKMITKRKIFDLLPNSLN